ncbi:MAG: type I pullulanase [Bifidobacteriaceae bacterium]|nr:type I pullulanase [Bifidobacteriaceae bacterium]
MQFNPSQWPVYDGELGSLYTSDATTFRIWSPKAQTVTLRLFHDDNPQSLPFAQHTLTRIENGAWEYILDGDNSDIFYDYVIDFENGESNRTADPWCYSAGANSERSMVINLTNTNPENWSMDVSPIIPLEKTVVWETHIGDFSYDEHSGIPEQYRAKYKAFTQKETSLDNQGQFPTGIAYLQYLGVTHVQLMPMYDYGSVDEAPEYHSTCADGIAGFSQYNWGYDPMLYNVPEGSYATNTHDGVTRIRECKEMIAALHSAGMRVIMDVVYNHMFVAQNAFEQVAPGYFCRRWDDDSLVNGSGCGNDMASEHPMFRKFIINSLCYWVREYHIDGFRFDLMGLIDVQTMNEARAAIDSLPQGKQVQMYGEPWAADVSKLDDSTTCLANKDNRLQLDHRIGWFCDETRDSIKGSVMDAYASGFVNGNSEAFASHVINAHNAWRNTEAHGNDVQQFIQYVSAHDDLTLWDKLCLSLHHSADENTFNTQDVLDANLISAGLILTSAGIPFMLSGEEFARTKQGHDNSFRSSPELNMLDWQRAYNKRNLVQWYRLLIDLRAKNPILYAGERHTLVCENNWIAIEVGDLGIIANPSDTVQHLNTHGISAILADSTLFCDDASHVHAKISIDQNSNECIVAPEHSFIVFKRIEQ